MKILKLSENQAKKLLKLVEEFFPTNFDHRIHTYSEYVQLWIPNTDNKGCEGEYFVDIHWYQLCLTELPKRIYKHIKFYSPNSDDGTEYYIKYGYEDLHIHLVRSLHPVDFLVDLVKFCKKNKYFKK